MKLTARHARRREDGKSTRHEHWTPAFAGVTQRLRLGWDDKTLLRPIVRGRIGQPGGHQPRHQRVLLGLAGNLTIQPGVAGSFQNVTISRARLQAHALQILPVGDCANQTQLVLVQVEVRRHRSRVRGSAVAASDWPAVVN